MTFREKSSCLQFTIKQFRGERERERGRGMRGRKEEEEEKEEKVV
jgi:hypothetical protein